MRKSKFVPQVIENRKQGKRRMGSVSSDMALIFELRKYCGYLEMQTGAAVSLNYLVSGIFVDFLSCLRQTPPDRELQKLIYHSIGGYRPTMLEDFPEPMDEQTPVTPEQGEEPCQSQQNKEKDADTTSAPAMLPPSSE